MYSLLGEYFTPDEMGRIQRMEQKRRALTSNGADVFESCIRTLKTAKAKENEASDWISQLTKKQELLKQKKENKN